MMYIHNINIFNRYLETDLRMFIPYSAGTDIKKEESQYGKINRQNRNHHRGRDRHRTSDGTGFADEGARVICGDINESELNETVSAIRKNGGEAEAFHLDVSDEENVKSFADGIQQKYGTIDILFNNAGVDQEGGKFMNTRSTCLTGSSPSICAAHFFAANT